MVDPNRKINRLTEKDIEFLDECEEQFKDRFSSRDNEFVKHCSMEMPPPPIVDQWISKKSNFSDSGRSTGGGGGGGGGGRGYRDNNRGGRRFYDQRGNFRRHPYNSRGGHGSGYRRRDF